MKLVLIEPKTGKVVKCYEEECNQFQIDAIFDDYIRLIDFEKNAAKATPPPGINALQLDNVFQRNMKMFFDEVRRREEVKKKADNYFKTAYETKRNNIKGWWYGMLEKLISKKPKSTPQT